MGLGLKINKDDVFFSMIPARKKDRIYSALDIMGVQICFGIAAWFFLTGSETGMLLPAREAIACVIFGNCFPLFLMAIIALAPARYGLEQMLSSVPVCGPRMTLINIIFFYVAVVGALALGSIMFGHAAILFWAAIFGGGSFLTTNYFFWAVLCLVVGWFFAYIGPDNMKWVINVAALFMMFVLIGLVYYIFAYHGYHEIFTAQPAAPVVVPGDPVMSHRWSLAVALEMNVGLGLSWTYFYGQWTRLAKSESGAYHGCQWGWGLLSCISGVFAALAALAIQQYDPTIWLIQIGKDTGSMFLPVIGLLLMAVANIMAMTTCIYPAAITAITHYPRLNWFTATILCCIPVFFCFAPGFYNSISAIYAIIGLVCNIYGAVLVTDYIFFTKGVFSMRRIFNMREGYWYWHGINPAAAIAYIIGLAFYLWTYNPITMVSMNGWFPYITAGIPTFVLCCAVYYVLMKFWVLKFWPLPILPTSKQPAAQQMEVRL